MTPPHPQTLPHGRDDTTGGGVDNLKFLQMRVRGGGHNGKK